MVDEEEAEFGAEKGRNEEGEVDQVIVGSRVERPVVFTTLRSLCNF